MEIGIIGHGFWPQVGGLERQIYDCTVDFAQQGHRSRVVCTTGENSPLAAREELPVPGHAPIEVNRFKAPRQIPAADPLADPTIPVSFYKQSVPQWAELLQTADALLTFGMTPAITGGMIKRQTSIPLVAVLPGIPEEDDARFAEVRQCGADAFVGVSRFMCARAKQHFDLEMTTIYNGVDTDFYQSSCRRFDYPFLHDLPDALITAPVRLDPSKGIPVLIDAFERVYSSYPETRLLITGNGSICHELGLIHPYYQYLQDIVRGKGLKERVIFAKGAIAHSDMPALYTRSIVCAMTSLSEGFGLGLAEAMSCGTPVVATWTEGMREIFTDGTGGYYAEPGNSEDVATKLLLLLADADLRKQMGKLAREHIVRNFPASAQGEAYLALLEKVRKN